MPSGGARPISQPIKNWFVSNSPAQSAGQCRSLVAYRVFGFGLWLFAGHGLVDYFFYVLARDFHCDHPVLYGLTDAGKI